MGSDSTPESYDDNTEIILPGRSTDPRNSERNIQSQPHRGVYKLVDPPFNGSSPSLVLHPSPNRNVSERDGRPPCAVFLTFSLSSSRSSLRLVL